MGTVTAERMLDWGDMALPIAAKITEIVIRAAKMVIITLKPLLLKNAFKTLTAYQYLFLRSK